MLSLFFGSLSRHAPSGILRLPLIRGIMSDADWRAFVSPPANENADIPPFHHAFPGLIEHSFEAFTHPCLRVLLIVFTFFLCIFIFIDV